MKIDPSGTRVDYGPQDQALRDAFLEVLREIGDDANPLRWGLEKWSKDSSKPTAAWSGETPPGTESVFPELTPMERRIVQTIWRSRKDVGVEIKIVGKVIGWKESQDIGDYWTPTCVTFAKNSVCEKCEFHSNVTAAWFTGLHDCCPRVDGSVWFGLAA